MTHICVGKLTIIGWDDGLLPGRRQAIISTNAGILSISPLGTNFSEFLIEIETFSFKKMHLNMSSGKWRPFCLSHNVLREWKLMNCRATDNRKFRKFKWIAIVESCVFLHKPFWRKNVHISKSIPSCSHHHDLCSLQILLYVLRTKTVISLPLSGTTHK